MKIDLSRIVLRSVIVSGALLAAPAFATPVGAVPEPDTWAMMIFGFGLAGSAMRLATARTRQSVKIKAD